MNKVYDTHFFERNGKKGGLKGWRGISEAQRQKRLDQLAKARKKAVKAVKGKPRNNLSK